jgi:site-specific recombinase XerD
MTHGTGKRRFHFKDVQPHHPAVKPMSAWPSVNQGLYADFRQWLKAGGYGDSALHLYSVAVRLALGFLDKPYWQIDPEADLERVRAHLATCALSAVTRREYHKGLLKLAQYLRQRLNRATLEPEIHWDFYLGALPGWLQADVRAYIAHCRRGWPAERRYRATLTTLSHLTGSLRWMAARAALRDLRDITPNLWYDYVDARLAVGLSPVSINGEWHCLRALVTFLAEQGRAICPRLLRIEKLDEGPHLPRDVPVEQLRLIRREIEKDAASTHAGIRRFGIMDRAWFLLMLYSGLRTGEVRRLQMSDLDLEGGWVRIVESKGLKDRNICLSPASIAALRAYFEVRGAHAAPGEPVFIYRHLPLTGSYCRLRLETYGGRCGVDITPHQLRHSTATLLLNAGMPVVAVQAVLGHEHIDTTLDYARLYDTTLAADYYQAIARVEQQGTLPDDALRPLGLPQLLALAEALMASPLSEAQRAKMQLLRDALQVLLKGVGAAGSG